MSQGSDREIDERVSDLLRKDAPPARDAMFRLRVLERRERGRFHLRSGLLLAMALAIALGAFVGLSAGGEAAQTTLGLIALAALATGYGLYRRTIARLLQRFGF